MRAPAIFNSRTLRGRLALGYALALTAGLVAFAGLSLWLTDRVQRSTLDRELVAAADAIAPIMKVHPRPLRIDDDDREQFFSILGDRMSGAIVASDGHVLASTGATSLELAGAAPHVADSNMGPTTLRMRYGEVRLVRRRLDGDGRAHGYVVLWKPLEQIEQLDRFTAVAYALAVPLIVLLATLAGGAIVRRGLRPLDDIASTASEINARDLSKRVEVPRADDELGRLAATLNSMFDRVEAAFERERRFTSDASHELRAPLSVILAEADLALRRERSPQEYRAALGAIVEEARALEALTADLLAAARTDAGGVRSGDYVDLSIVAARAAERLMHIARDSGVTMRTRLTEGAYVHANPEDLARVVISVVHNAVKHGRSGGTVDIAVERHAQDIELAVRDDGPGFSQEGLARAFDRFWRDDAARGRDGTGLGLAIAQGIVIQAGGTIVVGNRQKGGAEVLVSFPSAEPPASASTATPPPQAPVR